MLRSITSWKLLFLWLLPCYRAETDGVFECGTHGRFEYCIDGIPGCVVGCHCHPGYYFDTETKICEPNTKLTLNYRNHYIPQPTRVQNPTFLSNVAKTESLPTLTTHNIIDDHVNDITKNADDLGDWLYNQFFKTIENQVINNTNKDQLTRRSGRGSFSKHSKLKRRARRKGKKHKNNKNGLRGKLLRIAEDDSLFQSSDSSDSDSSSPDFTRSASSSESTSDEDHGHKKILLINKKPRPPLPSFIFLPNMNTNYYPPIGLPPPPVMPMYPMIPVPPMMPAPPLLPFPGHVQECDETTTTTNTETTVNPTTKLINTEEMLTKTESVMTTVTESDTPASDVPAQRSHHKDRKRKKIKSHVNTPDDDEDLSSEFFEPTRENRLKLMKLLRHKMNYPRIENFVKRHKKPMDQYRNQLIPPETLMDNDFSEDGITKDENSSPANIENTSELENVDFKYLSQLIHRVNENQIQDAPVNNFSLLSSPKTIISRKLSNKQNREFNGGLISGRRINQYINTTRNQQPDDSYYSNLGRQIATLIRTIDADKERQFNIEIEKVQQKTNNHPYFNENGPRTFWERSVRSPLRYFRSFKNRFDKLKNSNELLFRIENKVETVASTVPTLSLHELENLINIMETARTQLQNNLIKDVRPFTKSLNINLWPQEIKQSKKSFTSSTTPNVLNINRRNDIHYANKMKPEILLAKQNHIENHKRYPYTNRVKTQRLNDVFIKSGLPMQPASRNITNIFSKPINNQKVRRTLHSSEKRHHNMSPTILNYKNIKKYFFDNNNQYSFQNDDLRLHYSRASKVGKPQVKHLVPSPYFHHEINHIDYIS